MPRNLGGTPNASAARRKKPPPSHRSPFTNLPLIFVAILLCYGIGMAIFNSTHLRAHHVDIASIISSTKDAFISAEVGGTSRKRKAVNQDALVELDQGGWFPAVSNGDSVLDDGMGDVGASDAVGGGGSGPGGEGAIVPIDLTVNFLHPISQAPGAPPLPPLAPSASQARAPEDFLPVVVPSDVNFRWAHRAKEGSAAEDSQTIRAYRIVVRKHSGDGDEGEKGMGSEVWDTGKVVLMEDQCVPDSVPWGAPSKPEVGHILEWRVEVWDAKGRSTSSSWSKFAVGPETDVNWRGQWIAHPSDMDTFNRKKNGNSNEECSLWKKRRPLPLFRAKLSSSDLADADAKDGISSALLVMSGLGSFRASFDGVPLTTSGPIDPPFTDYSKRVSYRGFDVTPFVRDDGNSATHVIGVTMGSGWWDHRPVSGMAKPRLLPRGPATVIAQVIVTYASGKTKVVGQTGDAASLHWQVSRGHIRESDLFTGEMVDLGVLGAMEGWDTPSGWGDALASQDPDPYNEVNQWMRPVAYHTEVTSEERRQEMHIKAKARDRSEAKSYPRRENFAAPIGRLIPNEIPPVMAMERLAPDEIHDLGGGRWMLDYGKAFSGMLHFDEGVPSPFVPEGSEYPRAHGFKAASTKGDAFVTVIYGEGLEMTTGDINRVLTAGLGLHDGGPRHVSKKEGATKNTYCFPEDHDAILSQKDVYIVPKGSEGDRAALFAKARQSHFTTHSFRFVEVCCSKEPPKNAQALLYRTAVTEWGSFDSSNVIINGGYELVKNAMASNMLSVQSDCPHREKLPYGGDLVADSPSAMHMYDMSSFYKKTIHDWMDAQWDNGAYTETSVWQDLNDYAGIGHGAGETVWATAPPVLTVRHMQHYGDVALLKESLAGHVRWIDFLDKYFDEGMHKKEYDDELDNYFGQKSGLGDWLAMRSRDTYLTHTGFYMAAGRCVAYVARKVGLKDIEEKGMAVAKKIQDRIVRLYLKNGKDNFDFPKGSASHTPGPEMSLFSRIVPEEKRCAVLKNWFQRSGHTWPGDEERRFVAALSEEDKAAMAKSGELSKRGNQMVMGWSQWQGFNEGIFAIRYALKTLSDFGFHNVALRKASGYGMATTEYMMRHNATTMWESWWRSEDLYSRNHPMLGALAEWMAASAAGVSHFPTTTGSQKMLFWPRFPKSAATLQYASASQGTVKGEYAVAWRFEGLPSSESQYDSAIVSIRIRFVVPPGGEGVARPPLMASSKTTAKLRQAKTFPNLAKAKLAAEEECKTRRKNRQGFQYSWEYDRSKEQWYKLVSGKAIGTPCQSYLFHSSLDGTLWGSEEDVTSSFSHRTDVPIKPGLYEIILENWQLEKEVEGTGRIGNLPEYYKANAEDLGPYCKDASTSEWQIDDATHII